VDPGAEWTLTDGDVRSKAGWTPYANAKIRGRVQATVVRGRVIARDGSLTDQAPRGEFLRGAGAGS
jgi:dihydroorotase-like cyclic amidohydrolase